MTDAPIACPSNRPEAKSVMLYVGGSKESFRCICGCNCFHKLASSRYACNACGETYTEGM